ncbi:hypothetical protein HPB50_002259 [Hyalomma asiaticum]|uniref:Uncharacterized protein n=1 Tax=Hyalomma asiaticum TaxID=266040 RepID=A0ACB7T9M8_HYAAI|nr:hypothetical protein HPB50_002259 [Hyalomma asiaticum]
MLAHYRKQGRRYSPAHKKPNGEQAMTWRKLQAGIYQHGMLLHAMYPGSYGRDGRFCPPDRPNTLGHMVLGWKNNTHIPRTSPPTGTTRMNEAAHLDEEGIDQW